MRVDNQFGHIVAPHPIGVGALDKQPELACGQPVERSAVGRAHKVPVLVDAFNLVGIPHEVFVGVFERGEVDGEVAAVGRHVENVFVEDGNHAVGAVVMYPGKDDVRAIRTLFQVGGVEAHEAPAGRNGYEVGLCVVGGLGL